MATVEGVRDTINAKFHGRLQFNKHARGERESWARVGWHAGRGAGGWRWAGAEARARWPFWLCVCGKQRVERREGEVGGGLFVGWVVGGRPVGWARARAREAVARDGG